MLEFDTQLLDNQILGNYLNINKVHYLKKKLKNTCYIFINIDVRIVMDLVMIQFRKKEHIIPTF